MEALKACASGRIRKFEADQFTGMKYCLVVLDAGVKS